MIGVLMFKNFKLDSNHDYDAPIPSSAVPSKPAPYKTAFLNASDIPAFLALQNKVWKALPDDKKHHLKKRTAEDLQHHLDERMPLIGVKDSKGKLVAQCLLAFPKNEDAVKNLQGYPIIRDTLSVTAVVQSLCTDPEHAGKGLSGEILDVAKYVAANTGHVQIVAKVADDNKGSQKSFTKNDFEIASNGYDPAKKYPVSYFRHSIFGCGASQSVVARTLEMA
ncbi:MAG: hypothetical protein DI551_03515 [Micavibrio aeruginosavorus]|uniref:N-acetyltransferase domain-containing protein n=1 Tax=Micavibrio aeruginosavorus TaxID=349221 RepID=A0A2W5N2R1_9BACT|nr:MAG: hypothetical protein DI551_03515 [Micavibrio aeruginosavorus]